MKVVILAGGFGTRLAEETITRPKPLIEIGGRPVLWHILKIYAHYGFNEFIIALGYKGEMIKRYFLNYTHQNSALTVDFHTSRLLVDHGECDDWIVHLIETGLYTNTGGRIKCLESWLGNETFMVTYADGLGDIDLMDLLSFHKNQGRIATVTAVSPPSRFGGLAFDGNLVANFTEKPQTGEGWINGGFMVFEPGIFNYLKGDQSILEKDGLECLAKNRQLAAYRHEHFWQCMDTLRDKQLLDYLWDEEKAPWKVWDI
jgi:glucose-1-phosphate cytidylyltransferase